MHAHITPPCSCQPVVLPAQAFEETSDHVGEALSLYEARRLPQIRALVELVSFSYLCQYRCVLGLRA